MSAIKVDMVDISYSVLGGMTIDIVIVSFIFDSNTILAFDKANFSIRVEDGIIHINSSIWKWKWTHLSSSVLYLRR